MQFLCSFFLLAAPPLMDVCVAIICPHFAIVGVSVIIYMDLFCLLSRHHSAKEQDLKTNILSHRYGLVLSDATRPEVAVPLQRRARGSANLAFK
jgi:hypothetical protein